MESSMYVCMYVGWKVGRWKEKMMVIGDGWYM